jgi:dynein heavy chain 2
VIESIPENDKPSFFGLPSNIEKSWQRVTSNRVLNQLKSMCDDTNKLITKHIDDVFFMVIKNDCFCSGLSRSFNGDMAFDRNIWAKELTPVLNLWKKLHQVFLIIAYDIYIVWLKFSFS